MGIVAATGLTGFIGGRLLAKLSAIGTPTRAIVRRPLARCVPGVDLWITGLDNIDALTPALAGVNAVVHLAGSVRGRVAADFAAANMEAVTNLCEAAARQPQPPPLLLVSSLAASQPQLSHYAASKRAGEQALLGYPHLDWTILRPPAVYGPGDRELKSLFRLMRRGLTLVPGNPHQRLSFLHVDDLVEAILCWLQDPGRCRQGQFSIDDGAPEGYDWRAIAIAAGSRGRHVLVVPRGILHWLARTNVLLSRLFGSAPMLTPGKVRELTHERWLGGGNSYGAVTGWRPRYDLASGLEQMFSES